MRRDKTSSINSIKGSKDDELQRVVMPVIAERLHVGKRLVERAVVRVQKEVVEHEQVVDVSLSHEVVSVERVTVGREIDVMPEVRTEGDTLIIPVVIEKLVVQKRLVLSEEIRVTRHEQVRSAPGRVRLREERVSITRTPSSSPEELFASAHVSAVCGSFVSMRVPHSTAPTSGGHRQIVATSSRRNQMKDLETNRDKNLKAKKFRSDDIALEGKEKVVIPIIQENLRVGKREIERGGVRVENHLIEQPVEESIELREENVRVERLATDRAVTDDDLRAMRDTSIEMIEHAEVAMLSKEARVIEEVIVSKAATRHSETFQDTVRHNEVSVQQLDSKQHSDFSSTLSSRPLFSTFENDFRTHFGAGNFTGYKYDDFAPVYQYGYDIALSDRYRDKNWDFIERDAGLDWEKRNPGTWEKVKEAAKHAWHKTLGRLALLLSP